MTTFERAHVKKVLRHLLDDDLPRLVVAVTGPRQTGKTTIIRQALERSGLPYQYIPVDRPYDPAAGGPSRPPSPADDGPPMRWPSRSLDQSWLIRLWERARREARSSDHGFVLALDEIQHVQNWSGVVKGLWDQDQIDELPLRVIVSGSAPWSLLTGRTESMVGRFFPVMVRHWSLTEMARAFDVSMEQYLFFGGYPGAACFTNPNEWRDYIQNGVLGPAIERDIVALTRVRKPSLMRRLVDLVTDYSGQVLSYNKMLGQLQDAGNMTTLAHYLDLLTDAGLVTGLPKYTVKPHLGRALSPN